MKIRNGFVSNSSSSSFIISSNKDINDIKLSDYINLSTLDIDGYKVIDTIDKLESFVIDIYKTKYKDIKMVSQIQFTFKQKIKIWFKVIFKFRAILALLVRLEILSRKDLTVETDSLEDKARFDLIKDATRYFLY